MAAATVSAALLLLPCYYCTISMAALTFVLLQLCVDFVIVTHLCGLLSIYCCSLTAAFLLLYLPPEVATITIMLLATVALLLLC